MNWDLEWRPHIFKNPNKPMKSMLANHPIPDMEDRLLPIIKALSCLSGDRNGLRNIPYTAIDAYLNRNVPVDAQYYFQELLLTADSTYVAKATELMEKQHG